MSKTFFHQRIMTINFIFFLLIGLLSCKNTNENKETKEEIETQTNLGRTTDTFQFKNGIISFFEDSKGNYWFGTKKNGVCKFDGNNYTYFTETDGLPYNQVQDIQEDKNGNILMQTGSGICLFDGLKFTNFEMNDEWDGLKNKENFNTPSSAKWKISPNYLYFQARNNGIIRYDGTKLDYLAIPIPNGDNIYERDDIPPMVYLPFTRIYTDKDDKVWIGTFNRGVVGFDGKDFTYFNPNKFGSGTTRSLFQDKDGNYWFGANGGGVYFYDGKDMKNFSAEKKLDNPNYLTSLTTGNLSQVWAIQQDNKDRMWFGTVNSGVWVYDGSNMINYTSKDGLHENSIEIIYKDSKGELWFCSGMNTAGYIYKFNGKTFEKFDGF